MKAKDAFKKGFVTKTVMRCAGVLAEERRNLFNNLANRSRDIRAAAISAATEPTVQEELFATWKTLRGKSDTVTCEKLWPVLRDAMRDAGTLTENSNFSQAVTVAYVLMHLLENCRRKTDAAIDCAAQHILQYWIDSTDPACTVKYKKKHNVKRLIRVKMGVIEYLKTTNSNTSLKTFLATYLDGDAKAVAAIMACKFNEDEVVSFGSHVSGFEADINELMLFLQQKNVPGISNVNVRLFSATKCSRLPLLMTPTLLRIFWRQCVNNMSTEELVPFLHEQELAALTTADDPRRARTKLRIDTTSEWDANAKFAMVARFLGKKTAKHFERHRNGKNGRLMTLPSFIVSNENHVYYPALVRVRNAGSVGEAQVDLEALLLSAENKRKTNHVGVQSVSPAGRLFRPYDMKLPTLLSSCSNPEVLGRHPHVFVDPGARDARFLVADIARKYEDDTGNIHVPVRQFTLTVAQMRKPNFAWQKHVESMPLSYRIQAKREDMKSHLAEVNLKSKPVQEFYDDGMHLRTKTKSGQQRVQADFLSRIVMHLRTLCSDDLYFDDPIIWYGNGNFAHTRRGVGSSFGSRLYKLLCDNFLTFKCEEFNTSKRCYRCGSSLQDPDKNRDKWKTRWCGSCGILFQRDIHACCAMLRNFLDMWVYGGLKPPWRRPY